MQLEKKDAAETRKFSTIPLTFIAGETWTCRQLAKVADIPVEYLHGTVFVVVEVIVREVSNPAETRKVLVEMVQLAGSPTE